MCMKKHTKYQPCLEQWRCPRCGEKENFNIDDYDDDDCEKLHEDATCICNKCNYLASGKVVANTLMKLDKQIVCPTCKGKGTIEQSS